MNYNLCQSNPVVEITDGIFLHSVWILVPWYGKCFNLNGDFVEISLKVCLLNVYHFCISKSMLLSEHPIYSHNSEDYVFVKVVIQKDDNGK